MGPPDFDGGIPGRPGVLFRLAYCEYHITLLKVRNQITYAFINPA
jgi:hypothetical protein